MSKKPGLFLDRDGVINVNRADYVKSWGEFEFLPAALDGLRVLAQIPAPIIVVTNQSAINRGLASRESVDDIHARMAARIRQAGGRVDGIFLCPHRPDERCACRKPAAGLFLRAAAQFDLALAQSYFIGDADTDVQAALAIEATPVLVKTGRGAEHALRLQEANVRAAHVFDDLSAAAEWIKARFETRRGAGQLQ